MTGSSGYKFHEIDAMDIHFFWELFEEQNETEEVIIYADGISFI